MDFEDALIYLPLEEGKSVEEVYDERLFELRMFFLTHVPIPKVFNAKIELLGKIEKAYNLLSKERRLVEIAPLSLKAYDSELLFDLVSTFQQNMSLLKSAIAISSSASALILLVSKTLGTMRDYARKWEVNELPQVFDIRVSVAPDEIELLLEIEQLKSDGIVSVHDIDKLNSKSLIYQEAIRLSLWTKMDGNG